MRRIVYIIGFALLLGCQKQSKVDFTVEVMNPMTPVKQQGQTDLCWAYAMLAAIETEHISRGDSVHLSPAYVAYFLKQQHKGQRAMGQTLINLIQQHGLCAYDAYPAGADTVMPPPRQIFMSGAVYTPLEFAHSVCAPDEYIALTSVADAPYYNKVELQVPDNWEHNTFLNIPADSLLMHTEQAVRHGHGVCWEGDTSEHGFRWKEGVADLSLINGSTTDDHCMAIVGIAHDKEGKPFFIMKNSWGKGNAYKGLMYVSFDYFREKTIAIYMTKEAYNND